MAKLQKKIFEQMKPGSIIISNTFSFKDLKPDQVEGRFKIYKVGSKK
jgi:hypothetical protein